MLYGVGQESDLLMGTACLYNMTGTQDDGSQIDPPNIQTDLPATP